MTSNGYIDIEGRVHETAERREYHLMLSVGAMKISAKLTNEERLRLI